MPGYGVTLLSDFMVNETPPSAGAHHSSQNPDSARLANGDFVVAWDSRYSSQYIQDAYIAIQRYNVDGSVDGSPHRSSGYLRENVDGQPTVIGLLDGGFLVAWMGNGIAHQRFDSAGAPVGSAVAASPAVGFIDRTPEVTALPDGGWVVVWQRETPTSEKDIYTRTYSATGVAGPETLLSTSSGSHGDPTVATLADGTLAVLWTRGIGTPADELRLWRNGVETLVATVDTVDGKAVALLPDGRLVVAWGELTGIHGAFVAADGSASAPFDINVGPADLNNTRMPDIAVFPDGRFVVAWSSTANASTIQGQVFEPDGAPVPGTFFDHAPAGVNSGHEPISVVLVSDTDFVLTWAPHSTPYLKGARFALGEAFDFVGTPAEDDFSGSSGDDVAYGFGAADTLVGMRGNDLLDGGEGADQMAGGYGDDLFYVDNPGDIVGEIAGQGTDAVYASANYALTPGSSVEVFRAIDPLSNAAINLTGNRANQTITGNAGANVVHGGGGTDVLIGLGGNDIYYTDVAATQVVEAAGGGNDQLYTSTSYALAAGSEVELLSTSSHASTTAIHLTGNELANTLAGNAGINHLDGGQGADVMIGFGGNDRYYVDNVGDRVIEAAGGGIDTVVTSISYVLASDVVVELLQTANTAGTEAINLTGNKSSQVILGNAGANIIHGGGGSDSLRGLGGNDTYYTDVASIQIVEGSGGGTDALYTSVSYVLAPDVYVELLSTSSHAATTAINLTGNNLNQTLIGNAGANILRGGGGIDVLQGLGGNDTYYTDVAATQIVETGGGGTDTLYVSFNYTLASNVFVEVLSTNSHAATAPINLTGNGIGNTLVGNAGQNTLDGKGGNDTLVGLGGNDIFAFTTALGAGNVDQIQDMQGGLDKIGLDDAIFTGLPGGTLLASAFVTGTSAQDAGDRIIYNSATGQLFFDADGSGAGAQVHFATVTAGINLIASDFIVF